MSVRAIPVFVKTITGKVIPLSISDDDLIIDIKNKVLDKLGIKPEDQRLLFGGKQLEDLRTADSYGIGNKHAILIERKRSGHLSHHANESDGKGTGEETRREERNEEIRSS
jgi:ubiquitin-large subunit ribosomal protein L40e